MSRLLVLVACLLCLVASGAPVPPPGPSAGGCVLRIATGADVSGGVRERALNAVWNGVPGRPLACFVAISSVADEQRSAMISAAQARAGHYDVFNLDIQWIPEFADAGYLRPIDTGAHGETNDFLSQVWSAGTWDGVRYAVPFNTDAGLLYRRSDVRRPTSWQDMTILVRARQFGSSGAGLGLAGQFASYEGLTVNALEAIWAGGGEVVDAAGRVVIADRAGVAAVDGLIKAVTTGVISGAALDGKEAETLNTFREGRALFLRHWPSAHEVLSGERGSGGIGFEASPLPWQSVLGGQYLAVSRHSPRRALAQHLVAALTGREAAVLLYQCGGFAPARVSALYEETKAGCDGRTPTTASVSRSPSPSPSPPGTGPEATPEPEAEGVPPDTLLRALTRARPRPPSPYYSQFSRVFRTEVHELLSCWALGRKGCQDARTFTAALAPKLRKALAGG
ncbi:extracellular solute-binding protein [Streptosporangium sp. DT93]|uniref:extracellular solute-binding protein n=1 Tax=Streptosporangium sp. DT93 TaxID=3393428 RepID=UPI003CEB7CF4